MPLRDWAGKRLIVGVNLLLGRGRLFDDVPRKIEALARFARDEAADAAVCTGDLSALGTNAELAEARPRSVSCACPVITISTRAAWYVSAVSSGISRTD